MAKTVSADFITEKNKTTGAQPRTLLEIVTNTDTVFYSDRVLTTNTFLWAENEDSLITEDGDSLLAGGDDYVAKVLSWPPILSQISPGEEVIRETAASFELTNNPAIHTTLAAGNKVTLSAWYAGLTSFDQVPLFVGKISGAIKVTGRGNTKVSFTAKGIWSFFNKKIGTRINKTDYPLADPDDVGKIIPWGYGAFFNQPCYAIEAGAVSTLASDYTAGGGSVVLTDATTPIAFPESGTFLLGDETGTYTGISSNTLTGVTGLTKNYTRGDRVMENAASVKYIIRDHVCKSLSNARIVPNGKRIEDAVTIPSGSVTFDLDDNGLSTVTLTDLVAIRQEVSIDVTVQPDQPVTVQQIQDTSLHDHAGGSPTETTYIFSAVPTTPATSSNPGRLVDNNFVLEASALFFDNDIYKITKTLQALAGVPIAIKIHMMAYESAAAVGKLTMSFYWKGALVVSEQKTMTGSLTTYTTAQVGITGAWADFQHAGTYIEVKRTDGIGGAITFFHSEVWATVTHAVSGGSPTTVVVNQTTPAVSARITDAAIGGNSVADTLGGILIVDGEGPPDDISGTYTGTPFSLIERPGQVIHHAIIERSNNAGSGDIDLANSFQDVEDNLEAFYKFGFVVFEEIDLLDIIELLAQQCFCRFRAAADGKAELNRRLTSGTASKSLDGDGIDLAKDNLIDADDFELIAPGVDNVINDIEVLYDLELTAGGWNNSNAYKENTTRTNPASVALVGTRKRIYTFFAVQDDTMADDLLNKYLEFYSDPRNEYLLRSWARNMELEPTDLIELSYGDLVTPARLCEVLEADYYPSSALEKKRTEVILKIRRITILLTTEDDEFLITEDDDNLII